MNTVKLITEASDFNDSNYLIEEDEKGKKSYKIKGIFMQSNIKNRNGRVYPEEVLAKEVKNYEQNFIKKNIPILVPIKCISLVYLLSCSDK